MKNANSVVIYRGPSMLDGRPIVAIATGLEKKSKNAKTGGAVIQTWIMRADVDPLEASRAQKDASVCGDCPHRRSTGGACYVVLHQAPLRIWRAFRARRYARVSDSAKLSALFAGRRVRIGSYGDPAAVPAQVWEAVTAQASSWLGYTHQWRDCSPELSRLCMASCDSAEDLTAARAAGWRTFRVRTATENVTKGEFVCPASAEGGHRIQCEDCGACSGNARAHAASPCIMIHGCLAKRFINRKAA